MVFTRIGLRSLMVRGIALTGGLTLLLRPAYPQTQPSPGGGSVLPYQAQSLDQMEQLRQADVIYLGEQHGNARNHAAQLEIIRALQAENANLAIAMEMFQRPFQGVIDRYLAGDLSEVELIEQTEYEDRWGFDWEFYAPIVRLAQAKGLPILALNAPTEVSRQVARQGLTSLQTDDFRYIPPLSDIDVSNTAYQQWITPAFESISHHGHLRFDNFFAAQVLWDETMAAAIAQFIQANPKTQVVVLAGEGHVVYGYGIPSRVERRLGPSINQRIVLLNPPPDAPPEASRAIADLIWQGR